MGRKVIPSRPWHFYQIPLKLPLPRPMTSSMCIKLERNGEYRSLIACYFLEYVEIMQKILQTALFAILLQYLFFLGVTKKSFPTSSCRRYVSAKMRLMFKIICKSHFSLLKHFLPHRKHTFMGTMMHVNTNKNHDATLQND